MIIFKRIPRFFLAQHGRVNTVSQAEAAEEKHRFLKDFFSSAIELSWSWIILSFSASFYVSWTMFAVVWYLLAFAHGDLDLVKSEDHLDCVDNVNTFTSSFLFSLETQTTIGLVTALLL